MANFIFQVICAWVLLCVPGLIVVSSHLFFGNIFDMDPIDKNEISEDINEMETTCYENKEEYYPVVASSRFWIEGENDFYYQSNYFALFILTQYILS